MFYWLWTAAKKQPALAILIGMSLLIVGGALHTVVSEVIISNINDPDAVRIFAMASRSFGATCVLAGLAFAIWGAISSTTAD